MSWRCRNRSAFRSSRTASFGAAAGLAAGNDNHAEAVERYLEAIAIARESGETLRLASALADLGAVYATMDRLDDALGARGEADTHYEQLGRWRDVMVQRLIVAELYDRIVSSGEASRIALETRSDPAFAALGRRYHYVGPDRDANLLDGLDYQVAPLESADFLLNTGIVDDDDPAKLIDAVVSRKACTESLDGRRNFLSRLCACTC